MLTVLPKTVSTWETTLLLSTSTVPAAALLQEQPEQQQQQLVLKDVTINLCNKIESLGKKRRGKNSLGGLFLHYNGSLYVHIQFVSIRMAAVAKSFPSWFGRKFLLRIAPNAHLEVASLASNASHPFSLG